MKCIKIVSIVALIAVIVLSVVVTKQQSESGCSITTKCSPEAREFIINKFGDADNFTTVRSIDLTNGNTKSCGCLGKNYAKRNLMKGGYWNG